MMDGPPALRQQWEELQENCLNSSLYLFCLLMNGLTKITQPQGLGFSNKAECRALFSLCVGHLDCLDTFEVPSRCLPASYPDAP